MSAQNLALRGRYFYSIAVVRPLALLKNGLTTFWSVSVFLFFLNACRLVASFRSGRPRLGVRKPEGDDEAVDIRKCPTKTSLSDSICHHLLNATFPNLM